MLFDERHTSSLVSMDQPSFQGKASFMGSRAKQPAFCDSKYQKVGLVDTPKRRSQEPAFSFSRIPFKPMLFSLCFVTLGLFFLISSLHQYTKRKFKKASYYLSFATLLLLPGTFFMCVCLKIGFVESEDERQSIMCRYQMNSE